MLSSAVAVLILAACIGAGAALLAALGVLKELRRGERIAWCFAAGSGCLGWIVFFPAIAGFTAPLDLAVLCVIAASGLYPLVRVGLFPRTPPELNRTGWILCAAIVVALAFDLLEGASPPADADSLAYHFALPKQFLEAGRVEFVPRALDGAAPLLLHMTYLLALGLGGEIGLTLWTMVSGWMTSLFLFVLCRRFLDLNWSLAVTLIFLTTPAVLYGAGSGQVEVRIAIFVLGAAFAASQSMRTQGLRYVVLAGMFAGWFAGSKYTGLLFVIACGIPFLFRRQWFIRGAVYGLAAVVAGSQWYGWNWHHTGDPVFPILFVQLGLPDSEIWNARHDDRLRRVYFGSESPFAVTLAGLFSYPFVATLSGLDEFESGRTGFGPYGLLILPFVAMGAWRRRHRIASSELFIPAVITAIFYALWFYSASSQRIRHLLPVYPVLVICLTVAARHFFEERKYLKPAAAAAAMTVLVQLAGHGTFALGYARYVFTGESRDSFLRRNVNKFEAVQWINANLTRQHKVFLAERQLVYLTDVPVFYGHPLTQTLVDIMPDSSDPLRFFTQLNKQGITHLLVPARPGTKTGQLRSPQPAAGYMGLTRKLEQAHCAEFVKNFNMTAVSSRTLPALDQIAVRSRVLLITPSSCTL